MNYLKVYCNLIRKAENRTPPEGYTEKHHTFPKSIFGNNNRVVVLTAREHYVAHALLEKICIQRYGLNHWKTKKMNNAHILIKSGGYCNSYLYENAKIRRSENMKGNIHRLGLSHKEETKKKIGEKNKGKTPSKESNEKRSEALKGKNNPNYGKKWWNDGCGNEVFFIECPPNWIPGRNDDAKKINSEKNIGRKWWNDGFGNVKFVEKCPGDGWTPGISEETKRKISEANTGNSSCAWNKGKQIKSFSEEHKKKLSKNKKL
jgi:hypothetical protein